MEGVIFVEQSYFKLFHEITNTISVLDALKEHLISVQQEMEEFYISVDEA